MIGDDLVEGERIKRGSLHMPQLVSLGLVDVVVGGGIGV